MTASPLTTATRRPLAPRLTVALIAALALVLGPLVALPAQAVAGVTVSGTVVLDPAGDLLGSGVALEEQIGTGDDIRWDFYDSASTEADGSYAFSDVPDGTYRVKADGPQVDGAYSYGVGESAPFTVSGEDATADVVTLTPGGSISGTTSDEATEETLAGVRVLAHRLDGDLFDQVSERDTYADVNGDYTLTGLRTGTYRLEFQSEDYVTEYYDNVTDASNDVNTEGIEDIPVTAPAAIEDYDAALTPSGTIAGTVVDVPVGDLDESTLDGIRVTAYQFIDSGDGPEWTSVTSTSTSDGAGYSLTLPIGDYRIGFSDDDNGDFLTEFFDDQPSVDSAETLTVEQGLVTEASAALAPAGHITGSLTAEERDPFFGCVAAYPEIDGEYDLPAGPVATVRSGLDDSSAYDLGGLPTGTYRVEFTDCGDDVFATEYYDDQADFDDAEGVDVTAGETTPDIDAVLAEAPITGTISGTVTEDGSATKLAGITVRVDQEVTEDGDTFWQFAAEERTEVDGTYSFDLLGGSNYRLTYTADDGLHVTEYNGNVTEEDDAPAIALEAGDEEVVDAALTPGAVITGTFVRPLADLTCADAFSVNDPNLTKVYPGDVSFTDATYRIGGLPAGDYKVRFDCGPQSGGPSGPNAAAVGNWYLGKTSFADANGITAMAGAVTTLLPVVTAPPFVVAPPVVKKSASVKVSAKGGNNKVTFSFRVRTSGLTPTGKIRIMRGSKVVKIVTLKRGRAKVSFGKQKTGKPAYRIQYTGDSLVMGKTVRAKRIRIT